MIPRITPRLAVLFAAVVLLVGACAATATATPAATQAPAASAETPAANGFALAPVCVHYDSAGRASSKQWQLGRTVEIGTGFQYRYYTDHWSGWYTVPNAPSHMVPLTRFTVGPPFFEGLIVQVAPPGTASFYLGNSEGSHAHC